MCAHIDSPAGLPIGLLSGQGCTLSSVLSSGSRMEPGTSSDSANIYRWHELQRVVEMLLSHMGPQRPSNLNPHFAEKTVKPVLSVQMCYSLSMAEQVSHLDFLTPSSVLIIFPHVALGLKNF